MRAASKFLAIFLAGWLLVTVAAEGAFRLLGDRPTLDLANLYAAFADGNYKLAPNVDTAAQLAVGHLTVHTDELGLRCDAERRFAAQPRERVDVLLLGDSQGFGNGVVFEDSLAGSVAIAAARHRVRVVNASVGGHSAASQLQLAEWLHQEKGLRPSHYLVLVTPSIAQSTEHLNRATVGGDGRLYGGHVDFLTACRIWTKTSLVLYARVRDAAQNRGIGGEPAKDVPFVFGFYQAGATEARVRDAFTRYVTRLKEFAATHGARVHLVYVPLTLEMEFETIRASAASRGITIDRDAPLRACTAAAQSAGVPFVNLRPALEALHAQGDLLHLRGDFHYNPQLSRAAAARLWELLRPALREGAPLVSGQL